MPDMAKALEEMMETKYVCADCGADNDTMYSGCRRCSSVRVVLKSVMERVLGPQWREKLPDPESSANE